MDPDEFKRTLARWAFDSKTATRFVRYTLQLDNFHILSKLNLSLVCFFGFRSFLDATPASARFRIFEWIVCGRKSRESVTSTSHRPRQQLMEDHSSAAEKLSNMESPLSVKLELDPRLIALASGTQRHIPAQPKLPEGSTL